jgi:hypothetical protein
LSDYSLFTEYGTESSKKSSDRNIFSDVRNWEAIRAQSYDQVKDINLLIDYLRKERERLKSESIIGTSSVFLIIWLISMSVYPLWVIHERIKDYKMSRRIIDCYSGIF